ncbi:MAG: AmmeMemoRadiSam system protein B [Anaerolineae bacterium]
MMPIVDHSLPKLRAIDARPIIHGGQPGILLRDPLQLTDKMVIIPPHVSPLLALCDGTRDSNALSAALAIRFGVRIPPNRIEQFLAVLDDALLLDNDRAAQAQERALWEYRQAPFRRPANAGLSYPAEADELRKLLQSYLDAANDASPCPVNGRGLVCPHLDYARGGTVYAQVWKRASKMAQAAEIAVILGTNHYGRDGQLTFTRQHYATPFGILPTAQDIVNAVAQAVGEEAVFADELYHRGEHSIELAAIWLHYLRKEQPCALIPILCGSFAPFIRSEANLQHDPTINRVVDALRQALTGRKVLVIAAADLAHVGPAFGGQPLGLVERARLQAADEELVAHICAGDAEGFFAAIQREGDRYNICGLPPIYLALRLLHPVKGEKVAYLRCPADEQGTSLVSVCGIVFQ